jgi:hypothetical protein
LFSFLNCKPLPHLRPNMCPQNDASAVRLHELLKDLGCPKALTVKPAALVPLAEPGASVKLDAVMHWMTSRPAPCTTKNVVTQWVHPGQLDAFALWLLPAVRVDDLMVG